MIICHCGVVSDRAVVAAVNDGARTLAEVCRATGAGQGCGSCVYSLKALLCHHGNSQEPNLEVADATPLAAHSRAAQ